jgi:hypothetical protein
VFISGCSAGSVGSIAFAPYIIQQYPNARVAQLGDSLAFVFHRPVNLHTDYRAHDNFPSWIPELRRIRHGAFTMERFYGAVARFYPHHRFAQFNTVRDAVQIRFFKAVGGTEEQWEEALRKSLRGIQTAAPNFCHYLAGGTAHCVTPFDRFYTYQTNGVRLRTWTTSLEAGTSAATIQCTRCDVAGEGP